MQWKPNVTVAAVVMQDDKFLLVEEMTDEGIKLNQPAGHLEHGESLEAAIKREMLEETACEFEPKNLIGIYQWPIAKSETTYLRFTFTGTLGQHFQIANSMMRSSEQFGLLPMRYIKQKASIATHSLSNLCKIFWMVAITPSTS